MTVDTETGTCRFREDEDGDAFVVAAPFVCLVMFMMMALLFNAGMLAQKRHEVQIMADSAARAGTLAVDRTYAVRDAFGYHVYTELDPRQAQENALSVIDAYMEANYPSGKGLAVYGMSANDTGSHTYPEYSSRDGEYHERHMTRQQSYYNGSSSVELYARVPGIWTDILGMRERYDIKAYGCAQAGGNAVDRGSGRRLGGR